VAQGKPLTGDAAGWAALADAVKRLREESGLSGPMIYRRHGIGKDTIGRIEQRRSTGVDRSTLSHLSLIFGKQHDYLENVLLHRPVDETPTVAKIYATVQELAQTVGSMKPDVQWQTAILGRMAPNIAAELGPVEYHPTPREDGMPPTKPPSADR
jgi:hypothetical protein